MESEDLLQGHKKIVFAFLKSVKNLEKEMSPPQIKTLIDYKLGILKNHKMVEVGRDLRRLFSPLHLLQKDHPEHNAHVHIQALSGDR